MIFIDMPISVAGTSFPIRASRLEDLGLPPYRIWPAMHCLKRYRTLLRSIAAGIAFVGTPVRRSATDSATTWRVHKPKSKPLLARPSFSMPSTSPRPVVAMRCPEPNRDPSRVWSVRRCARGPGDRGRVVARRGQWPPREAVVQLGRAAVWIVADGVGVAVAWGRAGRERSSTRWAYALS
jgi:hypothetical protein